MWSETGSLNEREARKEHKKVCKVQWRKNECVYVGIHSTMSLHVCVCVCVCLCVFVCVSEMDSLWPGRINSLPDWLQLSRNVTRVPERDLIAIRELPPSSRGQRARRCNTSSKHPSLCEH